MKKNITELRLKQIIAESIKRVLKEYNDDGGVNHINHSDFSNMKMWDVYCAIRDILNNINDNPKAFGAQSYKEAFLQVTELLYDVSSYIYGKATLK